MGWLARHIETAPLGRQEALVVTALAHPLLALVAAVGYLPDADPGDQFPAASSAAEPA